MSLAVISVVEDMFFASKIRAVAEAVGAEISSPRNVEAIVSKARELKPRLVLIELHNQRIDSLVLARTLKSDEDLRSIKLIGFFSHVETELQRNAIEAGFDRVIPRSVFTRELPAMLATDNAD